MTAQSLIRPESLSKIGASSSTRLLNEDRLCMRSRNARRRGQRLRAGATPAYRKFTWGVRDRNIGDSEALADKKLAVAELALEIVPECGEFLVDRFARSLLGGDIGLPPARQ